MKILLIIAVMQATQAVVKSLKPPKNPEQCTSIAEVMGLNPVRALIFQALISVYQILNETYQLK